MTTELIANSQTIYHEMMTHPALFTHRQPKKIAVITHEQNNILQETLKHSTLTDIWYCSKQKNSIADARIRSIALDDLMQIAPNSLDIIITTELQPALFSDFFKLLQPEGILMQQTQAQPASLKMTQKNLTAAGFRDFHTVLFPQLNLAYAAIMTIKEATFRRVREKDIFNKTFTTHYYNLDVHKAALALPEFLREELEVL